MTKQTKTKRILGSAILVGLLILTMSLSLVKLRDRNQYYTLTSAMSKTVDREVVGMNDNEIMHYCLTRTASSLQFARYNNINKGKANCLGYAQFYSAVCNRAFSVNNIRGGAHPVVGYIKTGEVNLCDLARFVCSGSEYESFVKDHDFVEIKLPSKTVQLDPCLYDLIGISCMEETENK